MRRASLTAAILASALLVPAASATAKGGVVKVVASQTCKKERKAVGGEAFGAKYGSPAMPSCKSFMKKLAVNAAKTCKRERRVLGREAFNRKFGTGKKKRNALGECVSAKVKNAAALICPEDLVDDEDLEEEDLLEEEGEDPEDEVEERLGRAFASCSDEGDDWEEIPGEDEEEEEEGFEEERTSTSS